MQRSRATSVTASGMSDAAQIRSMSSTRFAFAARSASRKEMRARIRCVVSSGLGGACCDTTRSLFGVRPASASDEKRSPAARLCRAMREGRFELKVKDGAWSHHPDRWSDPAARMVGFTLVALRNGLPLGGHNVQAHVGSATCRKGPPSDASVWLLSGWWVTFRNQFAQAPRCRRQDNRLNQRRALDCHRRA